MATTDIFLALSADGMRIGQHRHKKSQSHSSSQKFGSSDARCPGSIEVLSFNHTVEQVGSQDGGRPRSVETVKHGDFTITKAIDAFSPMLFRICCGAVYIAEAKLFLYSARDGWETKKCPAPFLVYTMSYVHVSKVSPSGGSGVPTETIGLKYGQMKIEHTVSGIQREWSQVLEAPVHAFSGTSEAGDYKTDR